MQKAGGCRDHPPWVLVALPILQESETQQPLAQMHGSAGSRGVQRQVMGACGERNLKHKYYVGRETVKLVRKHCPGPSSG